MDLPPSGWYPDPYGAPDLLRWWDGATWTHHTHPGVGAADSAGGGAAGGGAAAGGGRHAAVQATTVQASTAQSLSAQSLSAQQGGGGWATRERVIGDWAGTDWPTGDQLASTMPPKGPRTEPQPALPGLPGLPATSVQSAVQPTAYQAPVQPTVYQPAVTPGAAPAQATTVQPATAQAPGGWPTNGWPTEGQHGGGRPGATAYPGANGGGAVGSGPSGGGGDAGGTQVLFLGGDAWQVPGGPGAPGGPGVANRYGYQEAQRRRRRMWLMGGLAAGTAVAVAVIVVIATSLGGSHGTGTADQAASTLPASPTAAAPSPTPTVAASASASASSSAPASVLSDGQSGLSYSQLATPWQPLCPSDLNSAFNWTAGESAAAGQVDGGQTTWYGEACSGPLPAQYNYTSVSDLDNTATNVASTLENAYYNALDHTIQPMLSQPISVDGHAAWEVEYLVNYTNAIGQGATWTTEEAAVVVADTGAGNTPVVFFTSIPDTLDETNVGSLVSSLQLTVVPNADSGSPTANPDASATADDGGSPTADPANP